MMHMALKMLYTTPLVYLLLILSIGGLYARGKTTTTGLVNVTAAHCWYNPTCNGTIGASFNNETNCCQFGDFSYIKCSQADLKKLLMNMIPSKKLSSACVRCPPKVPRKLKVEVCTLRTCKKLNERCLLAKDVQGNSIAHCLECDVLVEVCGSDNVSYPNECQMYRSNYKNNIRVAYNGKCSANPTCAGVICQTNYTCKMSNMVPWCVRDQVFCGTDNVTYASADDLFRASCEKDVPIFSLHGGPCNDNDVPVVVNASQKCPDGGISLGLY